MTEAVPPDVSAIDPPDFKARLLDVSAAELALSIERLPPATIEVAPPDTSCSDPADFRLTLFPARLMVPPAIVTLPPDAPKVTFPASSTLTPFMSAFNAGS